MDLVLTNNYLFKHDKLFFQVLIYAILLAMRNVYDTFSRTDKANIVMITLAITVSDGLIHFSRTGKSNIVMLTLPITVADC